MTVDALGAFSIILVTLLVVMVQPSIFPAIKMCNLVKAVYNEALHKGALQTFQNVDRRVPP